MLYGPTLIFFEDGSHFEEEVGLKGCLVGAVVRPRAEEASAVTVAEPVGDLLDGGLLQVVGEGGLAGAWSCPREDVTAGVGDAAS